MSKVKEKKVDKLPIAENERYRAPALDKGLDILELLSTQPSGMTRSEIVKSMGRNPSEVYRMVERLVARKYVARSKEGDRYSLTMKMFVLGCIFPPIRRLINTAQPMLDQFAFTHHQSIHLVTFEEGRAIVVAQASSPDNWEFRLRVGIELDILNTSSGKTLIAFQEEGDLQSILKISDIKCIEKNHELTKEITSEIEKIEQQGYRKAPSEQLMGVYDISVPVFNKLGHAYATLTCPFIKHINEQCEVTMETKMDEVLKALLRMADELSLR